MASPISRLGFMRGRVREIAPIIDMLARPRSPLSDYNKTNKNLIYLFVVAVGGVLVLEEEVS
jgi:hypothetical protein